MTTGPTDSGGHLFGRRESDPYPFAVAARVPWFCVLALVCVILIFLAAVYVRVGTLDRHATAREQAAQIRNEEGKARTARVERAVAMLQTDLAAALVTFNAFVTEINCVLANSDRTDLTAAQLRSLCLVPEPLQVRHT